MNTATPTASTIAYRQADDSIETPPYQAEVQSDTGVVFKTEKPEGFLRSSSTDTLRMTISSTAAAEINNLWEAYASANYDAAILPTFTSRVGTSGHHDPYRYYNHVACNGINIASNDNNSLMSEESSTSTASSHSSSIYSSSPFFPGTRAFAEAANLSATTSATITSDTADASISDLTLYIPPTSYPCDPSPEDEYKLQPYEHDGAEKLNFCILDQSFSTPNVSGTTHTLLSSMESQQNFQINGVAVSDDCRHHYSKHNELKNTQNIHSVMYHQHLVPANDFLGCISPENTFLSPPASTLKPTPVVTSQSQLVLTLPVDNSSSKPDDNFSDDTDQYGSSDSELKITDRIGLHSSSDPACDILFTKNPTIVRQQRIALRNERRLAKVFEKKTTERTAKVNDQKLRTESPISRDSKRQRDDTMTDTSDSNDEEFITEQTDTESQTPPAKKRKTQHKQLDGRAFEDDTTAEEEEDDNGFEPKRTRRTVTSYDTETTFYLKSIFFEVFSQGLMVNNSYNARNKHNITTSKLTKEQRKIIQRKTGLPSRNITYWFSNHKRRFAPMLKVYKKCMEDHKDLKTYKDFICHRRKHRLPEQITTSEVLEYEAKYEKQK